MQINNDSYLKRISSFYTIHVLQCSVLKDMWINNNNTIPYHQFHSVACLRPI